MTLSRRSLIRKAGGAGGALLLGFPFLGRARAADGNGNPASSKEDFRPNAFLRITPEGAITLQIHRAEMGQGVATGIATIVAEELEVDPTVLQLELAEYHPDFRSPRLPVMSTGGSTTIASNYDLLRRVGATARTLLIRAAAEGWQRSPEDCYAEEGRVRERKGRRSASYGSLVAAARALPIPRAVSLKEPAQFRHIGRHRRRLDDRGKLLGTTPFSIEAGPADALRAVVLRPPRIGAQPTHLVSTKARAIPGVREVVGLGDHGVAVVAEDYWQAHKAVGLLEVSWRDQDAPLADSKRILEEMRRAAANPGRTVRREGNRKPLPAAQRGALLEAEYHLPFLAHAAMEPLSCTVQVHTDRCEMWVGNQAPDVFREAVGAALGMPRKRVRVHSAYAGGSFGRRIPPDFAVEAAHIARQVAGPVRVMWSREDDIRHDRYRPAALSRLRVELDKQQGVHRWHHRIVCPSLMEQALPPYVHTMVADWMPHRVGDMVGGIVSGKDFTSVEGAKQLPYRFDGVHVEYTKFDSGVPIGFWRSVGHSLNAFVVESFVDEIAHAMQEDPVAFRRRFLPPSSALRKVLDAATEAAGWGRAPAGIHQGVALHESYGTQVAQVVELSCAGSKPRVERVVCAVDCGRVINPDIVRAQVEGAVVFALSAALYGRITLENGAVKESNFHDYPVLRMADMPEVETIIMPSEAPPRGIGEPGVPPLAPALANALFAAGGGRAHSLPLADTPGWHGVQPTLCLGQWN